MPTILQKRAFEIMRKNPAIKPSDALIRAGYSAKSLLGGVSKHIESKGFANLQDVYRFELVSKGITPKLLARQTKEGIKSVDLKTRLPYIVEAKKDLGMVQDAPDTLIQVNLSQEIDKLAT